MPLGDLHMSAPGTIQLSSLHRYQGIGLSIINIYHQPSIFVRQSTSYSDFKDREGQVGILDTCFVSKICSDRFTLESGAGNLGVASSCSTGLLFMPICGFCASTIRCFRLKCL